LEDLEIWVYPEFLTDRVAPGSVATMLKLWRADVPIQVVRLQPRLGSLFTRQRSADILSTIGHALEEVPRNTAAPPSVDEVISEPSARWQVTDSIYDWEVWRNWWWAHIQGSFPTFMSSGGLVMS
ncbi:hypothetical protein BD309DRAFT_841953, partial [Dichomitus squalens]